MITYLAAYVKTMPRKKFKQPGMGLNRKYTLDQLSDFIANMSQFQAFSVHQYNSYIVCNRYFRLFEGYYNPHP